MISRFPIECDNMPRCISSVFNSLDLFLLLLLLCLSCVGVWSSRCLWFCVLVCYKTALGLSLPLLSRVLRCAHTHAERLSSPDFHDIHLYPAHPVFCAQRKDFKSEGRIPGLSSRISGSFSRLSVEFFFARPHVERRCWWCASGEMLMLKQGCEWANISRKQVKWEKRTRRKKKERLFGARAKSSLTKPIGLFFSSVVVPLQPSKFRPKADRRIGRCWRGSSAGSGWSRLGCLVWSWSWCLWS